MAGTEWNPSRVMATQTTDTSGVSSVVRRFDDAWQRADIEALMSLVADDCVHDASWFFHATGEDFNRRRRGGKHRSRDLRERAGHGGLRSLCG
jgi:hypothetical protein